MALACGDPEPGGSGDGTGDETSGSTTLASTSSSSATAGSSSESGSSGETGAPRPLIELYGGVADFTTLMPVVGAEICIFEDDEIPCVLSNESGRYELTGPQNADVLISYAADGRYPKLRHRRIEAEDEDLSIFNMQTVEWIAAQFDRIGIVPDSERGVLVVQIFGSIEGATVALEPAAGEGPFYTGPGEELDPMLDSATVEGLGVAAFVNVPEGEYSLVVTSAGATCTTRDTPPGMVPSSALGRSVAGLLSETTITCE
jgi:hypothetical protein